MRSRQRSRGGRTLFVVVVTAASLCLAAFAIWCTTLVQEVGGLRNDVSERVVWMQQIHAAQSATTPAARAEAMARVRSNGPALREALATDPQAADAVRTLLATTPPVPLKATIAAGNAVVTALRVQTGRLSGELGSRWSSLYWLVGISLFLAASTLVLGLVLLRINAARARSDVERLEAQLLRADRLAALGTLAATVAHEINNPLAFVLANLELIGERCEAEGARLEGGDEVTRLLQETTAGAKRVATIVADLRTFSHPKESDASALADVQEALDAAVRIAEGAARGRAKIQRSFAPRPVGGHRVAVSDAQLCQVFLNLLVNAVQAIEPGAPHANAIQIRTRATVGPGGPGVVVEIQDSGTGIDPALAERLFDPFVTTKAVGQGTGLGLYVCRGIVDRAGGSIQVAPVRAGGTLAVVSLPVVSVPVAKSADPAPRDEPEPRLALPSAAKRRLLIIDDEAGLASALALSLGGFETEVAKDGDDGLAALLASDFDVVLCDLMMPGKTGAEVYEQAIAKRPGLRGAFVFMTGGALTAATESFLRRAEVSVLHKPFSRSDVRDALSQVGQVRQAPDTLASCQESESSERASAS